MAMPSLPPRLLFHTAGFARYRWNVVIVDAGRPRRRLVSTHNRGRRRNGNSNPLLTPGFQPAVITGDGIGFYSGSTFFEGVPPAPLPVLDVAAILAPGQYCKKSSWSTPHRKGTKSGVDAAQRLVEARRELTELIRLELGTPRGNSDGEAMEMEGNETRKMYAMKGHGVPCSLLRHLVEAARSWLRHCRPSETDNSTRMNEQSSLVKVTFANVPNSTLLDQDRIRKTSARGVTAALPSLPEEWHRDFEMYMVVMDRMASRMASLAIPSHENTNSIVGGDEANTAIEKSNATPGTGSVVTPSRLTRWDVTVMKGEALPASLLPNGSSAGIGQDGGGMERHGKGMDLHAPTLTLEWARTEGDQSEVVLRLQDDCEVENSRGGLRDSISLVFEGAYAAP